MSIDSRFLFVLLLPLSVLTFLVMRLKKRKYSKCFFTAFCVFILSIYFSSSFPLEFGSDIFQHEYNVSSSMVPLKNFVYSLNIQAMYPDGSMVRYSAYYVALGKIGILDFVLSVMISFGFSFTKKNVPAAVRASLLYCYIILSVRIGLYLFHFSAFWFDTAEYIVMAIGIALGIISAQVIRKRQDTQNSTGEKHEQ